MDRGRNIFISLIFSLVGLMVFTNSARANRWASLRNNQLIEDRDNVYMYPQLLLDYRNSIGFDYGSDFQTAAVGDTGATSVSNSQNGRVLYLGGWKNLGLGMSAYYGSISPASSGPIPNDLLSQETGALYLGRNAVNLFPLRSIGSLTSVLGGANAQQLGVPFGVVDAFLAIPTGIGSLGLRLGVGTIASYETIDDVDTGADETLLTLEAGLSGKGDLRWDSSLAIAFDFYGNTPEEDVDGSATLIRVSLSGRAYIPFADRVDLGVLGNLALANGSISFESGGDQAEANGLGFGVMGGLGPVFRVTNNVIITGYGLLGIAFNAQDQDLVMGSAENTVSDFLIFIPALRIAADIGVTDWFFFRTGIQYSFQLASSSFDEDVSPPDSASRRNGQFGWSAGVGLKSTGGFTVDATLSSNFLTVGPDFIGGEPDALFGVVSAAYHWL